MDTTPRKRSKIITLAEQSSMTQRQIAAECHIGLATVNSIIKRYRETGSITTQRKGNCGRKRKTSPADDRLIVRKSKLNPRLTAVDLTRELMATTGANIHVTTVRRRLLEAGRRARKPIKKQLLTPVMCKKRLMWAKLHQHWTVNHWKNVLFFDESHFEVHSRRVSYVRKRSEKVTAAHLHQAPKYPPKVMFWGCFTHEGPGALIPIKGMMNSDKYIHLLKTRIVPQLQKSFPDGRGVFQQDLAPCHTSRKTTEFFNKKNIQTSARGRPRQIACLLTSPENIAQMKKKQELKNEKINSKKGCRMNRKNVQRESEDMIEINDSDDDDDDDDDDDYYDEEDEDVIVEIDNEGSDDIWQFCMLKYSDPKSVKKGEWIQWQRKGEWYHEASRRFLMFAITFTVIAGAIATISSRIAVFSSSSVCDRCLQTYAFKWSQRKKSQGARSYRSLGQSQCNRISSSSRGEPIRGGPSAWGLGEGLTTHHRKKKKQLVTNPYNKPRNRTDSLARPQQRNKVLRFGTWNVTSLYRTGGVTLVAKKLARYRIDFVGVQEVRLDGNGISQIRDYLYYGEGNNNHQLGTGFFVHKRIKSAVKKVEFISDRLSYLVLKGRWCDIIVINAHASTEEKDDHIKDSFYEELEHTFDQLPRFHMKILLGDFNAKVGQEDIFRPTIGKESLYVTSSDNGIRLVNFATSKNLIVQNISFRIDTCKIYKTVILPDLLYGCETWTLTLREEHRLRVFENKVLRKIFGAKQDEVTGEWRNLHNTELHALYSSPDIIRNIKSRRLRWAGHVPRMGESRNAYRVLVGRPEGKRPLGRPRRRWEDNIKMDLREVGYDDRDWINLAQDRDRWRAYVRAAMNLRVP
ncbi:hypothetical protein ANN_09111 [Periplaneta americana]|uniref:Transposase Tc1-like domain-containing protein n=1 Tax=Periplaneta americana TaxID=6978 RepID=A0ABQ8TLW4_PERAM|nr:hypothetical protein ANN_09111 [Periplaneta americana]